MIVLIQIPQDPTVSCGILQDLTGVQEKGTFLARAFLLGSLHHILINAYYFVTWEPVMECSVPRDYRYFKSQSQYSTDYQFDNIEVIFQAATKPRVWLCNVN